VTTQNSATETFFTDQGGVQLSKAKALARTYARAVAGRPRPRTVAVYSADPLVVGGRGAWIDELIARARIAPDVTFEDGRKGRIEADLEIRDMPAAAARREAAE
jgi:hypothetical protein